MIEETARVVAIEGEYARVETQRKSTCESCSLNKGCGTAVVSKALGRAAVQLRAINHIDARVDQQVVIGIDERWLLKSSFAVYIVPLLLMLLCAGIGEMMAVRWWGTASEGTTILGAAVGLFVGLAWLRRYTQKLRRRNLCQPEILRSAPNEARVEFKHNSALKGQE